MRSQSGLRLLAALFIASLAIVNAQTLAKYQALVAGQGPKHHFKLDGSLVDSAGSASDFGVVDTGGGYADDFFGNTNACRFFSNLGDALTNPTDLIAGGGPIGGDPATTNKGTVTLLFRTLDAATNTGQRFVFSQGNTTATSSRRPTSRPTHGISWRSRTTKAGAAAR
ncbi:MAG: hypothetical protein MUC91_14415 [Verrucomicrobia bacterium]|nr:hypothetical protein [Verrucomicrobiota bacterium]